MVQLDGGNMLSSDLNDLYRRVINRKIIKNLLESELQKLLLGTKKECFKKQLML
jgi:DNA-directed RNA polymerase beta' subunit